MDKKIIIIGAGMAGLSAGCYARMNGYEAEIYESHSLPGGLCAAWSAINNADAGINREFQDLTLDHLQSVMNINFWGTIYGCRSAYPIMMKQRSGQWGRQP
jgi:uncharacterized protein with NAD-binding domain and iron-sulfur cluster